LSFALKVFRVIHQIGSGPVVPVPGTTGRIRVSGTNFKTVSAGGTGSLVTDNIRLRGVNLPNQPLPLAGTVSYGHDNSLPYFAKVRNAGANVIRWGFAYSHWSTNSTLFYQKLDNAIAEAQRRGIWLLPVLFTLPGSSTDLWTVNAPNYRPDTYEGYSTEAAEFWNSTTRQNLVRDMWSAIANRYQNEDMIAGWDLLNEPLPQNHGPSYSSLTSNYATAHASWLAAIRATGDNHCVSVEAAGQGLVPGMSGGGTSISDANTFYQSHYYHPFAFCDTGNSSYTWPGTYNQGGISNVWNKANLQTDWTNVTDNFPTYQYYGPLRNYVMSTRTKPMLVGEWGVGRFNPNTAIGGYFADLTSVMDTLGLHWTQHEYVTGNATVGWDSTNGVGGRNPTRDATVQAAMSNALGQNIIWPAGTG
jgi:hypothetical protein